MQQAMTKTSRAPLARRGCVLALALAVGGFAGAAAAHESLTPAAPAPLALDEQDFLGELPVVLSVSRLSQPTRDAPAAVTVIDAELIRASGARDLADLLRLVPGFQVAYGDLGSPLVVYHGYLTEEEPRRLQVLIDGRSQYSPAFIGAVNWNTIDVQLQDIERIEVIRGTNSATYGSNAFLGVINVITRNAAAAQGVEASVAAGSGGVEDRSARLGVAAGGGFLRLSGERRHDDGLPGKTFDGRTTNRAHLRYDQQLGLADSIELSLGQTVADVGVEGAANDLPPDRIRGYSSEHLQAIWRHSFAGGDESLLRVLRTTDRLDDTVPLAAFGLTTVFDHTLKAVRDEVEGQFRLVGEDIRIVLGAAYRNDSTRSRQFYGDGRKVEQTIWRGFGTVEWQAAEWLTAQASTTLENDSLSATNWSPRLMFNVKPVTGHTLRLGAARGHRVPTLFEEFGREEYFNTAPGPLSGALIESSTRASGGLQPEQIDSYELGYLLENTADHFTLDLRIFEERIDNAILWYQVALPGPPGDPVNCELLSPCGFTREFANVGRSHIRGVEYQARWQPTETLRLTWNQALIEIDGLLIGDVPSVAAAGSGPAQLVDHLQRSAPRRAQSLIVQKALLPKLDLFLAWHYVGPQKSTPGHEAPEYRRLDWRLAHRFVLGGTRGEIAYTVNSDGRRHVERQGTALVIPGATAAQIEASDWIEPRAWLSLRLEY